MIKYTINILFTLAMCMEDMTALKYYAMGKIHRASRTEKQELDPTLNTESYNTQRERWPQRGNIILAHCDADKLIVYQAFNKELADFAVANQRFGGPSWNPRRVTWIKTNFLWMMFRSDWGRRDPNL